MTVLTRPIPRLAAVSAATTAAPRSGGGVEVGVNASWETPLALAAFTPTSLSAPPPHQRDLVESRPARRCPYPCARSGPLLSHTTMCSWSRPTMTKEDLLLAARPFIHGTPKVIVAGYGAGPNV